MDKIFRKFLRRNIDLAPIGIERREDNTPYFCTPKGASVFGWAGADGIHFCFIRGFGGMVFAVSPENASPNYVHPLSKNFSDFLCLLLACGDAAVLEQAWMWEEVQFEAFRQDNPPTQKQQQTLSEIAAKMKLTPMERPWEYIRTLQSSFDYSKLRFTEDYYDTEMNPAADPVSPEWKVFFDGGFWGHQGKDHAGTEIRIDVQFDWAGHHWMLPALYSCRKGIVLDFCMRVESEDIRGFMNRWNLNPERDSCENFTCEQQMQMELENPLCLHFNPRLELNGRTMRTSHGCSVSFNPCLPDEMISELEAKWAVDHYNLDTACGWVICRNAFPWAYKRRPQIKTLSLTMEQQPNRVPGPHFISHASGDSFVFSHPVSGIEYMLTVEELERQTIDQNRFGSGRWSYPTNYIAMSYTLFPEPNEYITLCDCAEGDKPLEIAPNEEKFGPVCAADVAVIGGADGPTAILFGGNSQRKLHAAYSSLHFEPVQDDVEWRVMFHVRQFEEKSFSLI